MTGRGSEPILDRSTVGLLITLVLKVGDADAQPSEPLTKGEAGEEVVIERAGQPVARITRIAPETIAATQDTRAVIEEVLAGRARRKPASREEIRAWKNEGRA